ncbi:hypothetical protein FNF31_07967 [Cafeteria roenbergensis]|uniref:IPT/TIG domain-containing protein n=1 Tax=Cafeteria roenbergensis TaxID=33653 RepID=A0A5A8BYA0_CAFRO|nr:hypothetical protein FNF31_07967 [Cafeteria roenbergensis]
MSSTGIFFSPWGAAVQLVGTGIGFTAARLEREGLTMAGTSRWHSALLAGAVSYEPPVVAFYEGAGSSMSCMTAEGAGRGMQWAAVVDGQASTVPSTSYGAPRLVSISGLGTDGATTDGGEEVVLRGANFGPSFELLDGGAAGFLSSVTYGPSRREYMAQGCRLASHSEIRCRTSAGVGRGHRWRVVVGGQETADYRDTVEARAAGLVLDYASPVLSSVSPLTGTTEGGFTLHLSGTNLGLSDARRASSGDA